MQSRCLCPHRAAAMHRPLLCHKAGGTVGAQAARAAARWNLAAWAACPAAILGRRLAFLSYLLLNLAGRAALRAALAALLHPAAPAPGCTALRSIARACSSTRPPEGPAPDSRRPRLDCGRGADRSASTRFARPQAGASHAPAQRGDGVVGVGEVWGIWGRCGRRSAECAATDLRAAGRACAHGATVTPGG
jgi:hypothetical protein